MHALLPDLVLMALAFFAAFSGAGRRRPNLGFHASWIGLLGVLAVYAVRAFALDAAPVDLFGGAWRIDRLGLLWRVVFTLSALCAVLLSRGNFQRRSGGREALTQPGEFFALLLFSTLGGITVVSARELLTLFIGLELATIPLFFLAAWNKRDDSSGEASVKYVAMGGVSSAVMLFGLSYLYGFCGSLSLDALAVRIAAEPDHALLWIGVLFVIAGAGFKLTLFPFHLWAPDVYEGSSTPLAAYLSVGSKSVAIAFLATLVCGPFAAVRETLTPVLLLLAGATTLAGNLGALKQGRLRRFMAWSGVSQAGFLVLALAGPAPLARSSLVFYMFVYAFANYLAFFVFAIVARSRDEGFSSLRGMSREWPALAVLLAISMFSLAGIPPMAGFLGKFGLLASAASGKNFLAVAFMVLNGVIGLYIYLTVLRSAWVDRVADGEALAPLESGRRERIMVWILAAALLLAGIVPFLSQRIVQLLSPH
ncbi:MAG: NADH-quinone oxidoreductase subunit N [Spirochaetes bacterium]|nr:NADH-quinone oxidoreductase subunit N [Spirochaetota bacterium]